MPTVVLKLPIAAFKGDEGFLRCHWFRESGSQPSGHGSLFGSVGPRVTAMGGQMVASDLAESENRRPVVWAKDLFPSTL